MKVKRAVAALQKMNPEDTLCIPVSGEGGIGGRRASEVRSISSGFDWDSGRVFLHTAEPVFRKQKKPRAKNAGRIVCLCGSTRFRKEYEEAFRKEEHAGNICLTVPCFKDSPCCKTLKEQESLDALHRRKIDLADELFIVNVGGYIGSSTRKEIEYAELHGKSIRWLETPVPESNK